MSDLDRIIARTIGLAKAGPAVPIDQARAMTGMSARHILLAYDRGHIRSAGAGKDRLFETVSLVSYAHRHLGGREPLHLFDLLRSLARDSREIPRPRAETIRLSLLRRTSAPPEDGPWGLWFRDDLAGAHALMAAEAEPPEHTVLITPERSASPGSYVSYQRALLAHREAASKRASIVSPWPHLERVGPVPELEIHDYGIAVHEHSSIGARRRTVHIPVPHVAEAVLRVIEQLCSRRRDHRRVQVGAPPGTAHPGRPPHGASAQPPGPSESMSPTEALSSTKH